MANLKNTTIDGTVFRLPAGDTAARPASPAATQLRFNTETGKLEQFRPGAGDWIAPNNTGVIATGGDSVYDVDVEGTTYRVHVFTSTGTSTFSVLQGGEVEYLIVAGGGGGSGGFQSPGGGGGGAGGLLSGKNSVSATTYSISVGAGGSFGTGDTNGSGFVDATNGGDSSAFSLTAIGGGKGGSYNGVASGSGGSAGGEAFGGGLGSPTAGQGNAGGSAVQNSVQNAGGGGGAGGPGQPGGTTGDSPGGDGGIGLQSNITGTSTFYAGGGGGGGGYNSAGGGSTVDGGSGGLGGGGAGGSGATDNVSLLTGKPGTPNTGGGGGGAGGPDGSQDQTNQDGGAGGSGIVVIRYPLRQENPVTAPGRDVQDGLVLDLDFAKPTVYSGSGSVVNDSRLSTESTNNGAVFVNPRTHRSAFRFNRDYIQLPDSIENDLNGKPEATLIMWLKLDDDSLGSGDAGLIQLSGYTSGNGNLYYYTDSARDGGVWLDIFRTNREYTGDQIDTFRGINWHMLTVTTKPGSNGWQMYLNNILKDQTTGNSSVSVDSSLFGGFRLGQNSGGRDLLGEIAMCKIYNRYFDTQDVEQFFNATRWRFGV